MIVVFGSINVDLVVPVPLLPGPGETVLGGDYALLPGGKGANQALAARRAGAEVVLAGAVGIDSFAAVALGPLRQAGIDTRLVRSVAAPTGCAAIMVSAAGENMIAVASGANASVRADQLPDALLGPGTLLVAQMEVPCEETAAAIRRVRARGGRSLVNFAPALPGGLDLLREVDFVVANQGEAALLGADPASARGPLAAGPDHHPRSVRGDRLSHRWRGAGRAGAADRPARYHRRRRYLCRRAGGGARRRCAARNRAAAGQRRRRARLSGAGRADGDAGRRGDRCGHGAAAIGLRKLVQLLPSRQQQCSRNSLTISI